MRVAEPRAGYVGYERYGKEGALSISRWKSAAELDVAQHSRSSRFFLASRLRHAIRCTNSHEIVQCK